MSNTLSIALLYGPFQLVSQTQIDLYQKSPIIQTQVITFKVRGWLSNFQWSIETIFYFFPCQNCGF